MRMRMRKLDKGDREEIRWSCQRKLQSSVRATLSGTDKATRDRSSTVTRAGREREREREMRTNDLDSGNPKRLKLGKHYCTWGFIYCWKRVLLSY